MAASSSTGTPPRRTAFHWYKVVRSHGENPSYVPWTEGSQLIGVIENRSTTQFTDTHVESGQTWFYRVQAIGFWHGKKVVLGQTAAIKVTIPYRVDPMHRLSGPWSRRRQYRRPMAARSAPPHRPGRDGS